MIEYGIASLVVVALSLLHRPAMPYAITLAGGWLAGFLPVEVWWFISLTQGAIWACLLTHRSPAWQRLCAICTPISLMCDGWYWLNYYNNQYVGVEYANALNVLFILQLACVGFPGMRRLVGYVVAFAGITRAWFSGLGGVGNPQGGRADPARDPGPAE